MERPQQTGLFIMIGAAFALVVFLWSITRRSYMAVALPVMGAMTAVSALAFWIGWTMFTAQDEDEDGLGDEGDTGSAA
jgi:lipopolysaccharide export LptBFGC system permease protein LptF